MNKNKTPIIAIASGKGGAGKTSFTLNLATALADQGRKVLLFDADIGLANLDVQLGLATTKDLSDVIQGHSNLMGIMTKSERGFYVIPGRSGFEKAPFLTALERRNILTDLRDLAASFDVVLLDVAAGVDDEVLHFSKFADRTLLVTTPDPSSITDAYAVVKLLKMRHEKENCEVVINQAGDTIEGKNTYEKIRTAADKFLNIKLPLVGIVPYDRQYSSAVKMQQIAMVAYPACPSALKIKEIASKLLA